MLSFFAMLTHLRIQNFALIEDLVLDFSNGLSFFTGETGAGKSILIDAICRLLGARAAQDDVRANAIKSILEAEFEISDLAPRVLELIAEWGIDLEDAIVIRREIYASGKSRSLINNCTVTLIQLREMAPYLVDIFGQNEHQSLLEPTSQRNLFDSFAGVETEIVSLSRTSSHIRLLQEEWKELHEREQQRERNIDMLQFQIREIQESNVSESEEQELVSRKRLLQNSEKIHNLCDSLLQMILEKDESLTAQLKELERGVSELRKYNEELAPYVGPIQGWQGELRDLIQLMAGLRKNLEFEEGTLDDLEQRLELFHRLKRKYGPSIPDVMAHFEKCQKDLESLQHAEGREVELKDEITERVNQYEKLATEISRKRQEAKLEFEQRVESELKHVAMERCRFQSGLSGPGMVGNDDLMHAIYPPYGRETVLFEIEPNPGEGFRELHRIASGGELSRLMLALKVVCQSKGSAPCLIFDEIDSGVGGKTAYQIGERLRKLSRTAQVLCVTHLPQVAAFGDHHLRVAKQEKIDRTITQVETLSEPHRIRELARMLSGSEITETALQHARELRDQVLSLTT